MNSEEMKNYIQGIAAKTADYSESELAFIAGYAKGLDDAKVKLGGKPAA